ncbi:hypothetical protein SSX86_005661 [Deinandra increscens subsp. villosa]|uniref:DUF4408 domain-containing protein n=1 Tax=Deinandra increscens subsp. villosa TaxID=3103831 RepID=A0AAP0H8Q3_9ASTR
MKSIENTNAIFNNRRLHKITTVFRFMEMFFFLLMVSRFSSQLPPAVKLFGDYFKSSNFTIFSPKFVFVIGNLIILILFLISRAVETGDSNRNADLSYEYVESFPAAPAKLIVVSKKPEISRSKSENPMIVECRDGQTRRKLKRSVTEIGRSKNFGDGDTAEKKEELNCEDFRRTVEAFIARQQRNLRDEELLSMVDMGS